MIVVTKVDLHSLKLNKLNELVDAGYKPVAWVPYSNRMVIFLEGEGEWKTGTVEELLDEISPLEAKIDEELDVLTPINDTICKGVTVAGNPCKGARYEGTEYCVAHQDQG